MSNIGNILRQLLTDNVQFIGMASMTISFIILAIATKIERHAHKVYRLEKAASREFNTTAEFVTTLVTAATEVKFNKKNAFIDSEDMANILDGVASYLRADPEDLRDENGKIRIELNMNKVKHKKKSK